MAELFKDVFNQTSIGYMATALARSSNDFDKPRFLHIATENLDSLELKERSNQIVSALLQCLPNDYLLATDIIEGALAPVDSDDQAKGITDWLIMPVTEYVGLYGQHEFQRSMQLFHSLTQRFSAEFGIRHFLLAMPDETLNVLSSWTKDKSVHVRRLVSEGTRPTLPWGIRLPTFLQDPTITFALLDALKDDEEEYVRRSVANHLNDLSKQHQEWFVGVARKWMKNASKPREKLVKHAARSAFKQGHPDILSLFGFKPVKLSDPKLNLTTDIVEFGHGVEFEFSGSLNAAHNCQLMVDFVIHHQKANGKMSPKVFKWKTIQLKANEAFSWKKFHPMKPITTRKYYGGEHKVEIVVNGKVFASELFSLTL
jgi:3-methyladenine DNA glycosylase AlkC